MFKPWAYKSAICLELSLRLKTRTSRGLKEASERCDAGPATPKGVVETKISIVIDNGQTTAVKHVPDEEPRATPRKLLLHPELLELVTRKEDYLVQFIPLQQGSNVLLAERTDAAGDEDVCLVEHALICRRRDFLYEDYRCWGRSRRPDEPDGCF